MSITLKKNDYKTSFIFNCLTNTMCVPLVAASVVFELISLQTQLRVGGGDCIIEDASSGRVRYDFKPGELQVSGKYQGKVTIRLPQGAKRESTFFKIEIVN